MNKLDLDTARDLLADALGVRRTESSTSALLGVFSAGMMLGAALALLLTPKRVTEQVEELGSQLGEKAREYGEKVRDRVMQATESRTN